MSYALFVSLLDACGQRVLNGVLSTFISTFDSSIFDVDVQRPQGRDEEKNCGVADKKRHHKLAELWKQLEN